MITRRRMLASTAAIALAGAFAFAATTAQAENRKIKLQLAWLPNASSAGEIVALKNGYFAEKGLDVEILPGGPGTSAVQEAMAGVADIAIAYAPQVMYAGNQGLPIKSFAASYQKAPLTFYSLGEKNIKSVEDWKGKVIGAGPDAKAQVTAVLDHHGMKLSDITLVQAQPPAPLLEGQVDAIASWPTNVAQLASITQRPGGYNTQSIWDNGLEFQSNYYIAKTATIEGDTDMLVKFLEAVDKGWAFTADNPEKAVEIVLTMAPALDAQKEVDSLKVVFGADYIYNADTREHGFGNIDAARWQRTLDTYARIGEIKAGMTADAVFDDRVLKAAQRTKR
ncbi:MAG: ABC transporter substrate-binding protein [Rhizobiales bacterium]|jgi:NitT/TauT family transport system substrate-binding protein|nr:ABC transporter substrate-binding protein [Hyphomicrobiales bacterium]OJU35618.1 MAG: hypothetical protein BGN94_11560 [Rhizobiales bacterium 68-8]